MSNMIQEKERCRQLMMAELDGEISHDEKIELRRLLNKYPDLQQEHDQFYQLKEVTNTMKLKEPRPEIWETYWYHIYNRIERGIAWIILTLGAGILIVYGLMEIVADLWKDQHLPLLVKIGIFGLLIGIVLLLLSVLREKLFLRRQERYKEVQR